MKNQFLAISLGLLLLNGTSALAVEDNIFERTSSGIGAVTAAGATWVYFLDPTGAAVISSTGAAMSASAVVSEQEALSIQKTQLVVRQAQQGDGFELRELFSIVNANQDKQIMFTDLINIITDLRSREATNNLKYSDLVSLVQLIIKQST